MSYKQTITDIGLQWLSQSVSDGNVIFDNIVYSKNNVDKNIDDIIIDDLGDYSSVPINRVEKDPNGLTAIGTANSLYVSDNKALVGGIIGHTDTDSAKRLIALFKSDDNTPVFTFEQSQVGIYTVAFSIVYSTKANIIINSDNYPIANMNDINSAVNNAISNYDNTKFSSSIAQNSSAVSANSANILSKADKSSVDAQLASKANVNDLSNYATNSNVSSLLGNVKLDISNSTSKVDLSSYTTKDIVSSATSSINSQLSSKANIVQLDDYIKSSDVANKLSSYATVQKLNDVSNATSSQFDSLTTANSSLNSQVDLYKNALSTINDTVSRVADNPTLYKTAYNQFYHYNIPSGFMNDIQSIIPVGDHWNIYYLSNADYGSGAYTEWRLVQTKDFKQFTNAGTAIKKNQGGWESVASGSIVFNKQSDGHIVNSIYPDNAIIAFFTGYTGGKQIVYQAVSFDDGLTFQPAGDPVSKTPFGSNKTHRDPSVIYNPNNKKLVMYLAEGVSDTGSLIQIYQSDNGANGSWSYVGTSTPAKVDFTDSNPGGFECPHVIKGVLDVNSGAKYDIMLFSANAGGNGNSVFYQVGTLDNNYVFKNSSETRRIDFGYDFYAAGFTKQDDDSLLTIGWIGSWNRPYSDTLKANNNNHLGSFTLPRKLTLNNGWIFNDVIEPASNKILSWTATNGLTLKDDNIHSKINAHFNSSIKNNVFTFDYGDGKIIVTIKDNNILIAQPQALLGATGASSQYFPDGVHDITFYLDNGSLEIYLTQSKRIFTTQMISNNKSVAFNSSNTIDVMDIYNFNNNATLI